VILIGRFLAGVCAGGVSVLIPLYVAEISESKVRGTLGSFFIFSLNFGTLLMFVAGSCLSFSFVAKLSLVLPITFAVAFGFLPETPQHLLKFNKEKKAEKSLKFFRGCQRSEEKLQQVKRELLNMKLKIQEDSKGQEESVLNALSVFLA
jgi:MFS family permease